MDIKAYNPRHDSFTLRETDAEPYFTSYRETGIADRMKALVNGSALSGDPDIPLTDLAFTSYVLSNCAARYRETEEERFRVPGEITDRECANVLSRYPDLIQTLDKKIGEMTVGTPGYADYLTLRTCLSVTFDTVSRTRAVEDVRGIRTFGVGAGLRTAALERFLADGQADPEDDYLTDDVGFEMESDDSPEETGIDRVREDLRSYRNALAGRMNPPDGREALDPEAELVSLRGEIEALDKEFTPDFTARYAEYISGFGGAADFDGLAAAGRALKETGSALSVQMWSLNDRTNRYFRDLGFEPDAVPPYTNVFTEYLEGRRDFAEAETPEGRNGIRQALEAYLGTRNRLSDENVGDVVRFYRENAPAYRDMRKQYSQVLDDRNGLEKLWKRTELACRADILIDRMGPRLEEMKRSDVRAAADAPDAALRASLGKLGDGLKKTFKFGFNSTEYNAFRKALKTAAAGGDMSELARAAEKYINGKKRDGTPSTDSGRARLAIAEQALLLARTGAAAGAHPIETQASVPLPEPSSAASRAAEERLTVIRASFTASYPDAAKPEQEPAAKPEPADKEPQPVSAPAERKMRREPENNAEARFFAIIDSPDDQSDRKRQQDTKQHTYIESRSGSLNEAHERFYPVYIGRTLYTEYGFDADKCTETAEHIMRIIDNNLTGNFEQDVKFAYRQFREELLLPKDGNPPVIPGYTQGNDRLSLAFGAVWSFIGEYDRTIGAEMHWSRNGTPTDSRDRLAQNQLQRIEERYQTFADRDILKPDYAASIIALAKEPGCTFNQRNFLLTVDEDSVMKAQDSVKNAEDFRKMFSDVIAGMEKERHEKRLNMHAEAQKQLDRPDVPKF